MSTRSNCPGSPRAAWKPRTVYTCLEARHNWAWQPKRAALLLKEEQRRKAEEKSR